MSSRSAVAWVVAFVALVALLPGMAAAAPGGAVRLELVGATSERVMVRYTIENLGSDDVVLLTWDTPLEGFLGDILDVRRDGEPVPYVGAMYKLGVPPAEAFRRLAPGESASVELDLAEQYLLADGGFYSVRPRTDRAGRLLALSATSRPIAIEGEALDFFHLGSPRSIGALRLADAALAPRPATGEALSYQSCSAPRKKTIASAFNAAKTLANESSSYATGLSGSARSSDSRARTWFGAYQAARYNTFLAHFNAIKNAFATKTFVFNCACTRAGVYAYVYPSQPYKVYLCPAFWTAGNTGIDSKGGTIIHEASHFTVLGGTDDWAYGTTAAKALAKSNPARAVDNADSHEYYAESGPPGGGGGGGGTTNTVEWTLNDKCFDGAGLYIRFFDTTRGGVYPSASSAYSIPSGRSGVAKFNAPRGSTICLGAEPNPRDGGYWCVGLDNNHAPQSGCCSVVPGTGKLLRNTNLICD